MPDIHLPIIRTQARDPRFGVTVTTNGVRSFHQHVPLLGAGWYSDWWIRDNAPVLGGMGYVQTVNVKAAGSSIPHGELERVAREAPGSTWLIGNEIDIWDQNGMYPHDYARVYHTLYTVLKRADPSCRVAPGSVSQFTPSRRRYLDRMLDTYRHEYGRTLPCDLWNVHGYAQPELPGIVGLPPGEEVESVAAYTTERWRAWDTDTFINQLTDFRHWLDQRGYHNRPFIVSEYGVLDTLPDGPTVRSFLAGTMRWMARTNMVAGWAWFCANDPTVGGFNPHAWLVDSSGLTETGRVYAQTVKDERCD